METTDDRASRWVTRALYAGLIGANLLLAFDAWAETASGKATLAKVRAAWGRLKARAEGCEGCARRRAALNRLTGHMLWDAHRAVEGEPIETVPDIVPRGTISAEGTPTEEGSP